MATSWYLDSMFNDLSKDMVMCASKYFSKNDIEKIYTLGYYHFGENKVQDLLIKKNELKTYKITWHLIGHLQKNKVKSVINEIDYLHSLDSLELTSLIQKYRIEPLNCFIQVNLTEESAKSGINQSKLSDFLEEIKKYDKINVIGLMTIGKENDLEETDRVFSKLDALRTKFNLSYLSIGMSADYTLALKYQPRFIRIGNLFKGVI